MQNKEIYICKKSSRKCIKGSLYRVSILSHYYVLVHIDTNGVVELFIFKNSYDNIPKFYDYFCTKQEERKLKLEQLNNVEYK